MDIYTINGVNILESRQVPIFISEPWIFLFGGIYLVLFLSIMMAIYCLTQFKNNMYGKSARHFFKLSLVTLGLCAVLAYPVSKTLLTEGELGYTDTWEYEVEIDNGADFKEIYNNFNIVEAVSENRYILRTK